MNVLPVHIQYKCVGFETEDGKGYGLEHIQAGHGLQIRNAGFNSVVDFVNYVAKNYDENNIKKGKKRPSYGTHTYLIQAIDTHENTLFIELSNDGTYWNVNSGGVFRKGYSKKRETVAKTEPQQPNNAFSTDSLLSDTNVSGISVAEPNGESTVSNSKDTTSNVEIQINEQKFSLITPEMDAAYMDAVNNGDMETAQRMVMEAAKLVGDYSDGYAPYTAGGVRYLLSDKIDEKGYNFIVSPNGTTVFGEIKKESGLMPAPIKLTIKKAFHVERF